MSPQASSARCHFALSGRLMIAWIIPRVRAANTMVSTAARRTFAPGGTLVISLKPSGVALVLSLGAVYVGCTQDFNKYEPGNGFATTTTSTSSGAGGQGGAGGDGCSDDSQCNDLISCTVDTCDTATGSCVFTPAPDGPVPGIEDVADDCVDRICSGGAEKTTTDDTEMPADDMNPCTTAVCAGGVAMMGFAPADTGCGAGLVCNAMGACVGCNNAAQCPGAPMCQNAKCNKGTCGVENLNEGVPCAAGICNGMGACVECVDDLDCTSPSEICSNTDCILSCPDGSTNGDETDVDCGGGGPCPKCDVGKMCDMGTDCSSGKCNSGVCAMPVCNDNVKNGAETDVDCGGPTCPKCPAGATCMAAPDCLSLVCTGGTCKAPACNDTVKNGTETDVDCGGNCPANCADGLVCMNGGDCQSGVCAGALCQAPACNDNVKNGAETDVDCGGNGGCPKCANNKMCQVNTDCTSNKCTGGMCK